MISPQHRDGIRLFRRSRLLRLFDGPADDFGLGNLPARGQALEALGGGFVQREGGAVGHRGHTITHTIMFLSVKAGATIVQTCKIDVSDPEFRKLIIQFGGGESLRRVDEGMQ